MNLKIQELNFLYLYRYCQENQIDVSVYEDCEIEEISKEDIRNIINCILVEKNISSSFDDCKFNDNVEKYINQSETENLSLLGIELSSNLKKLVSFRERINVLIKNYKEGSFLDDFVEIERDFTEVKKIIALVINAKQNKKSNKSNSRAVVDLLFS